MIAWVMLHGKDEWFAIYNNSYYNKMAHRNNNVILVKVCFTEISGSILLI